MINTKTTINIYTMIVKCEMLIAKSLCGGTRREVFKLTLHGTPYNVLENTDHINLVQGTPGCLWYAD